MKGIDCDKVFMLIRKDPSVQVFEDMSAVWVPCVLVKGHKGHHSGVHYCQGKSALIVFTDEDATREDED